MVVPGSDHFFVAKVQTLLSAILVGVVGTVGTIFLEEPCTRSIFYAPLTILFTGESVVIGHDDPGSPNRRRPAPTITHPGWSLTFSLMEFSMGIPLIGTVRMANALVTGLLIGKNDDNVCMSTNAQQ